MNNCISFFIVGMFLFCMYKWRTDACSLPAGEALISSMLCQWESHDYVVIVKRMNTHGFSSAL